MPASDVLKPCPFCGSLARIWECDGAGPTCYAICCSDRTCRESFPAAGYPDLEAEIRKWNRRTKRVVVGSHAEVLAQEHENEVVLTRYRNRQNGLAEYANRLLAGPRP